jgi:hypothetical protein
MDNIVRLLGPAEIACDIGCGRGSFDYSAYRCRILGIDVDLDRRALYFDGDRVAYVRAHSHAIPLPEASVDAVICNHSLEHIPNYEKTLEEIGRILKTNGFLWIAVPNGFGFDDRVYRLLYAGGGHVNRFTFETIRRSVESITGLRLLEWNTLLTSFTYCRRPPENVWPYLPRRLKLLHNSRILVGAAPLILNAATRLIDKSLRTGFSIYGWGFVFGPAGSVAPPLPSYFNVCSACGSGHRWDALRPKSYTAWHIKFYKCPHCEQTNLLFNPPAGFC